MLQSLSRPGSGRIVLYVSCAVVPLILVLIAITRTSGKDSAQAAPMAVAAGPAPTPTGVIAPTPTGIAAPSPTTRPAATTEPATLPAPATRVSEKTAPAVFTAKTPHLSQSLSRAVQLAVAGKTYQCSAIQGGAFANFPFEDVCPDGLLIGFRVSLGKFVGSDIISSVQPIYLTPTGEIRGKTYGLLDTRKFDLKAPAGYAVAGATLRGGGGLDAVSLTFMPIAGTQLNTHDACTSISVGGRGGGEGRIGSDGTPVIGICGRVNEKGDWLGLGLVFLKPTPNAKIIQ